MGQRGTRRDQPPQEPGSGLPRLTPVCHHPHVGFDHLQVDPVLLLADDDSSPEPPVGGTAILGGPVPEQVSAVPGHVLGRGHRGVIWERDKVVP